MSLLERETRRVFDKYAEAMKRHEYRLAQLYADKFVWVMYMDLTGPPKIRMHINPFNGEIVYERVRT